MALPTTRDELIEYCKRKLGDPVIEINVDDDQVEDRVDEAIQYYQEFHSDAVERTYLKHQVTQTDLDNGYVDLNNANVLYLIKMFPINTGFSGSRNFFDIKYQMMLNDIADLQNFAGDMAYYEQIQQYLSLLDMKLNGTPQVSFSRLKNRLYIFGDVNDGDITVNDYIIFEALVALDPASCAAIYKDMWLLEYSTALIKEQWGANLSKFEGMQLPGGVSMNGRQIYEDARQEIEALREKIRLERELPIDFFVG